VTWNYAYTPYIWPSLGTLLFLLFLTAYSGRHRSVPGATPFMIACLFGAAWAACIALEYAASDLATKIVWVKFGAIFKFPLVTAITCFILEYAWPGRWLTRKVLVLLSFTWLLEIGIILTDSIFHLAYRGFVFAGSMVPQLSLGGWLINIYAIAVLGTINLVVFGWLFLRSPQQRWPVVLMLVGQIMGRMIYLLERTHILGSALHFDLLGMVFEFSMYTIALFGFRIFDPISMARQAAIEQLQYGMLVIDLKGKILSLNPAVGAILGSPVRRLVGRPIQDVLPDWVDVQREFPRTATSPVELSLGTGADIRDFQVDVTTLNDWRGLAVGRLLMLRDVTEQKKAQAQILEQQRALARSQERELLARELHDELSQDLSFINVEAQAVCDELAAGQVEQASSDLKRLAKIAREAQVDVRGQITRLSLDILSREGFPGALRQFVSSFWNMYGIQAELCINQDPYEYSLEPTAEVQLLRIVQEAFTNIRKHANAQTVRVLLENLPGRIVLSIEDDGVGFESAQDATERATFGLRIMSQRAAEMGGRVTVHSNPGNGTRVVVEVPVSNKKRSSDESLTGR
jgi:PAS domain S-box-containing protein